MLLEFSLFFVKVLLNISPFQIIFGQTPNLLGSVVKIHYSFYFCLNYIVTVVISDKL